MDFYENLFNQTFSLLDLPKLIALVFLEGILSVDNAVALAALVRGLPAEKRRKALFIGTFSAFFLRAAVILGAALLIRFFWIQCMGGLYLVYIGLRPLFFPDRAKPAAASHKGALGFFKVVCLIEATDLLFALDSILAALALIGTHPSSSGILSPKLWMVYVGGMTGLIAMRFAIHFLASLIDRYPSMQRAAHLMVAWAGAKLTVEAVVTIGLNLIFPLWATLLFWALFTAFFCSGLFFRKSSSS